MYISSLSPSQTSNDASFYPRSLVERIVAFRVQSTHGATGKVLDEEQMKRFLATLLSLWPDNWISVA